MQMQEIQTKKSYKYSLRGQFTISQFFMLPIQQRIQDENCIEFVFGGFVGRVRR